jgi:hypothetical protein
VNSNPDDALKGNNQHFRTFALGATPTDKSEATIVENSRQSFFGGKDRSSYQRVLRLSRPLAGDDGEKGNGGTLGVAATGFADPAELAIFHTGAGAAPPVRKGVVRMEKEVEDVDILQTGREAYDIIYCEAYKIWIKRVPTDGKVDADSECVFKLPEKVDGAKGPSFRAVRWLTKEFVIVLVNKANREGSELRIMRVITTVEEGVTKTSMRPSQTFVIPKIKQGTNLAVADLAPPQKVGEAQDTDTQFIVAVAAQDQSISLCAFDYQTLTKVVEDKPVGKLNLMTQPRLIARLPAVHPLPITNLAFSPAPSSDSSLPSRGGKAKDVLRLASVSVGNTVVVHSIPLVMPKTMLHWRTTIKPIASLGTTPGQVLSALAILLLALLIQGVAELNSVSPKLLQAEKYVPQPIRGYLIAPETVNSYLKRKEAGLLREVNGFAGKARASYTDFVEHPLATMIAEMRGEHGDDEVVIIEVVERTSTSTVEAATADPVTTTSTIHPGSSAEPSPSSASDTLASQLKARVHASTSSIDLEKAGKKWEELSEAQRKAWIQHLREIGYWAGELPTHMFKGVVFGEIAGAIGRGVAEGVLA